MASSFSQHSKSYWDLRGSKKRITVLQGGTRSGKTTEIVKNIIGYNYRKAGQGVKTTISRNSLPLLRETVMQDFFNILKEEQIYTINNHNKTQNTYNLYGNLVEFQSYQTVEEASGGGRDILFVNECNEQKYEIIEQLRIRTTTKEIYDFNPSAAFWLHDQRFITKDGQPILDGNGADLDFYKSTYLDNPFLSASQVATIERLKITSPKKWKVFGLGELGDFAGRVFTNTICVDERPAGFVFSGYGLDFGFSNDVTALVEIWLKRGLGRVESVWLKEIIYQTGLTGHDTGILMKERNVSNTLPIICDSARPDLIEEIRRAGFNTMKSAGKDILAGVDLMQSLELLLDNASPNLLKEFQNYAWATDRLGRELNVPEDCFNHVIDAVRYHLFTIIKRPVANELFYGAF